MRKSLYFAFFTVTLLQSHFAQAQINPEKIRVFDRYVQKQMKADQVPGLTIGVIKDGKVWIKGYGSSDLENNIPTKAESAYRLASITKPMTAIAILQLVEKGKIDLGAEVQKYVPYFPRKKYPVRVGQLLGHIGGISHYKNYAVEGHFKNHKNTREAIRVFEDFDLIAEPGTRFQYSSYGYNLLGAIIEGASGKSYGEYMKENVWKPLGMNATRMDGPNKIIPNRVRGYRLINGKLSNSEFVDISSRFAAGGTRSTVGDLLKFADGMSRGKLLSKESREKMWTAMTTRNGLFTNYGMGWVIFPGNGHFAVSHSGGQAETRTFLYVIPNRNFAIAAAINFENSSAAIYVKRLFELILDEPWSSINIYPRTENDLLPIQAIDQAFKYGMRYFDRYGKPMTLKKDALGNSFAFFNNSLKLPNRQASEKLQKGRHPAGNLFFVKMASFMASKLKENSTDAQFKKFFQTGAIGFFDSYIKLYKKNPRHSSAFRFSPEFEEKVEGWNRDWAKTWNDYTKNLNITASSDFQTIGLRLQKQFSGSSVYPNFIGTLDSLIPNLARSGQFPKAFTVGKLNYDLYPRSSTTNATMGILNVVAGNIEIGSTFLSRSKEINPRGAASPRGLNSVAYDLAGIGQTKAAMAILRIAVKLHPKSANLYDSLGEFYARSKQKEKAIASYSKALEIDPKYPNASKARKIIEDLKKNK